MGLVTALNDSSSTRLIDSAGRSVLIHGARLTGDVFSPPQNAGNRWVKDGPRVNMATALDDNAPKLSTLEALNVGSGHRPALRNYERYFARHKFFQAGDQMKHG